MPASTRSGATTGRRSTRSKQTSAAKKKTKAAASTVSKAAGRPKKATPKKKASAAAVANPYAKAASKAASNPKTSRRVNAPKKKDIDAIAVAMKGPPMKDTDVAHDDIAAALAQFKSAARDDPNETKYAGATVFSSAHSSKRQKMLTEFASVISRHTAKFGFNNMLDLVPTFFGPMPRIIVGLGGDKTNEKIQLASAVLWCFVEQQRNQRPGGGNRLPYLQPNSQAVYLRTLLGILKQDFGWQYSLSEDFNFTGGLTARINGMFAERAKKHPGLYGTGSNKQEIKEVDTSQQLDLSVFDERQPEDLIMKLLVTAGGFFGIRGNKEHSNLGVANIERGIISESGHEFEGVEYVSITNLLDKSCKLTIYNTIARQSQYMRLPNVGPDSPAAFIIRFLGFLSPGQTRLYCKPASAKEMAHFASMGWPNAKFSPNQPLGHNKISEYMKKASKKLGLDVTGHGFRRLFITTLVNDGRVSAEESLGAARHGSVAAQRTYMARNHVSEANRFKALGQLPPPKAN